MDPIVVDQALPPTLFEPLLQLIDKAPLTYGAKSNSRTDPHGHFSWKPVHDARLNLADLTEQLPPLLREAWQAVQGHLGKVIPAALPPWRLIRCYVNGYPYGCDGYFHRDSDRPDECTAILYICRQWPLDWGGETAVSGRLYWAIMPAPNRLLVIPSNELHAARAVSRQCPEMRTVLVFKFRPRRTARFEDLSQWLVRQGALTLKHGKDSSLHDHLLRTYWLLQDKVPADVAMGGGLHSVYGTNAFATALMPPTPHDRAHVARFAGKTAEDLAYKFSILDRPKTLDWIAEFIPAVDVAGNYAKLELRCKDSLSVDHATARALCLIECANLADQGSLKRWKHLTALWDRLRAAGKSS